MHSWVIDKWSDAMEFLYNMEQLTIIGSWVIRCQLFIRLLVKTQKEMITATTKPKPECEYRNWFQGDP